MSRSTEIESETGPQMNLGKVDFSNEKPSFTVHVDLDGARQIFEVHGIQYDYKDDPLFESGLKNTLDLFDEYRIKAVLFTIADDLKDGRKRELLEEAVLRGHEIASHSVTHRRLTQLSLEEKRGEIAESKRLLESSLNVSVRGFRAPHFAIDRECLELLDEYGYEYDSSVFPTARYAKLLEVPIVPSAPHIPFYGAKLLELPLPSFRPRPFPFHPCYSLILGQTYFRGGLKKFRQSNLPLMFLFHLTDVANPLPGDRLKNWRLKLMTLSHLRADKKLEKCRKMLDSVTDQYSYTINKDLVENVKEDLRKNKTLTLAISTTHETGAAILEGATVKAAVSEERMDRVKFSTQYPPVRSIEAAIKTAGVDPRKIDRIVVAGLPSRKLFPKLARGQWRDFTEFHGLSDYFPHFNKILYRAYYFYRSLGYRAVQKYFQKNYGTKPELHFVEHHLCHASSVYRTAPFEDALIVTADGVGDELSLTVSEGRNGRIKRLNEIPYPHSFGQFYTACTQILGFRGGRHEGKITGLSGFGKLDPELYRKVKETIRKSGPDFTLDKRYYSEGFVRGFSLKKLRKGENLFEALQYRNYKSPLKRLIDGYTREDVAAVFQTILEEEMIEAVRPFAESTGLKNLALAGGIFANVKLNDVLFRALGMKQVYIFPHMGDGGLSVGAALELLQARPKSFDSVYWGPSFTEEEMESALKEVTSEGLRYRREHNIEKTVAFHLAENKVIARFNGAMEFGPRALCNRSILYQASDPSANKWLNDRLNRTEFMPFAPVALEDKASLFFESMEGTEHACKFMTTILKCTDFAKTRCPAVVHVDGTARPQLISESINPSATAILRHYDKLTGVPLLVNTSFNMHEEPIVCSPEDAVRAYLDSKLDFLAMGPFLAWLKEEDPPSGKPS
ncbi:MAG: polysaccharide deacetylase family protein [Verrucomicrobia bacterium]|nr:polysaccharide deacetylase family protein [Verrucomicrobiota bacterium]